MPAMGGQRPGGFQDDVIAKLTLNRADRSAPMLSGSWHRSFRPVTHRRVTRSNPFRNPVRLVPVLFLAAIVMGAVLLSLPVAKAGGGMAPPLVALFTSASAVSVTGLITVDTATYWTPFGQAVILALFQIGGFGIMTAAVILGLVAGRDIRLRDRLVTQVERSRLAQGNARSVLYLIFFVTLFIEGAIALILAIRLHAAYDHGWGDAIWHGLFHSVSAFNDAGFSSYSDSVMGFQQSLAGAAPEQRGA
jgi:trk system potassium uptake protein TrkH